MHYHFTELVDLPGFQQVMPAWYIIVGVPTALLDPERQRAGFYSSKMQLGCGQPTATELNRYSLTVSLSQDL